MTHECVTWLDEGKKSSAERHFYSLMNKKA